MTSEQIASTAWTSPWTTQEQDQGHRPRHGQHRERVRQGLDHAPQRGRRASTEDIASRSRPAASVSTSPSASAATRAAASSKSTARSRAARPRSRCTPSPASRRQGGVAAFIDAEHALDPAYARKLGVKTDELLVCQPDYGEQALEIADMLVRSNAVDLVVVDSVAALVPKAEIEGDMGDSHVGLQARLMSQALRKLTSTSRAAMPAHLHQPDPHEDRRHVRQPRDHDRRQRAQVLRERAPRHPPHRRHQGGRGRRQGPGGRRQPHARQGREEQDGAPLSARSSSTSSTARASPARATWSTSRPSSASSRRAAPGSPSRASASARAARTRKTFLEQHPELLDKIENMVLAQARHPARSRPARRSAGRASRADRADQRHRTRGEGRGEEARSLRHQARQLTRPLFQARAVAHREPTP